MTDASVVAAHGKKYGDASSSVPRSAGDQSAGRLSRPPTIGPANMPTDHVHPMSGKARARCASCVTSRIVARHTPPTPEKRPPRKRVPKAHHSERDSPKSTRQTAVPTRHAASAGLRPRRSESRPQKRLAGMPATLYVVASSPAYTPTWSAGT